MDLRPFPREGNYALFCKPGQTPVVAEAPGPRKGPYSFLLSELLLLSQDSLGAHTHLRASTPAPRLPLLFLLQVLETQSTGKDVAQTEIKKPEYRGHECLLKIHQQFLKRNPPEANRIAQEVMVCGL